jgi:predicted GIY-YIG superfamily endonuclease
MYTIYTLIDPRDYAVRYIGITNDVYSRFRDHVRCDGSNPLKDAWMRELRQAQAMLIMKTLETVETVEQARGREKHWIHHHRFLGANLLNLSTPALRTSSNPTRIGKYVQKPGKPIPQSGIPVFKKIGRIKRRRYEELGIDDAEPVKEVVLFRHHLGQYWPGISEDMKAYYDYYYFSKPSKARDGKDYAKHVRCWKRRTKWLAEAVQKELSIE